VSATLFDIKRPVEKKTRKQRSDKGKPRKKVELHTEKAVGSPPESIPRAIEVVTVAPRAGGDPLRGWDFIRERVCEPGFVLPAFASLCTSIYVGYQGYIYLLQTNSAESALSTALVAEIVMVVAACLFVYSRGFARALVLALMLAMVGAGAIYMHSAVDSGQRDTEEQIKKSRDRRDELKRTLDLRRKGVEALPETMVTKREEALRGVAEYEEKLAQADLEISSAGTGRVGVTYNLMVRLCAMILTLVLTHVACSKLVNKP
jgi:hypothetical protein